MSVAIGGGYEGIKGRSATFRRNNLRHNPQQQYNSHQLRAHQGGNFGLPIRGYQKSGDGQ